ncbi:MAG: beta-ketodecanoyl-[acyl-carrier-protein] synthase [Paraglaciecola sp.]
MSRANDVDPFGGNKLFHQKGRKVFKEVCPMVIEHVFEHLSRHKLTPNNIARWWLHQANINMNTLISRKLLNRQPSIEEAPIVLDTFANTASAGSIIAFYQHHKDLKKGDVGLLCSFGAGYSIGSLVLQKNKVNLSHS